MNKCPKCGAELEIGFYEDVPAWICPNDCEYADFSGIPDEFPF